MIKLIAFDLDNTIYPRSTGLLDEIDRRIAHFIMERLNVDYEEAHVVRRRYLESYGTTAQGLAVEHGINPLDFLKYVDHVPAEEHLKVVPREPLRKMLLELPYRRAIFTNSTVAHADTVLSILEIDDCFEFIHDLVAMKNVGKPNLDSFSSFLARAELPKENVLFVDDNGQNISAAMEYGLPCVMVREADVLSGKLSSGTGTPFSPATEVPAGAAVIESILDLPNYLRERKEHVA